MADKIYPEWVQKYRTQGTTVKRVGENYYLYKHSSKRVEGKKNPMPKDSYIGRITPDGVIKSGSKKINTEGSDVIVKEYGFSKALEKLCPSGWKEPLGKEWQKVLDKIILTESPESYITELRETSKELDSHIQLGAQKSSLQRRMNNEYGIEIRELKPLLTIYLVKIGDKKIISRILPDQKEILERFSIKMEVD